MLHSFYTVRLARHITLAFLSFFMALSLFFLFVCLNQESLTWVTMLALDSGVSETYLALYPFGNT